MLSAIRRHTKSVLVKILAGILIVSFALWGVNDMFSVATTSSMVFEVEGIEFGPREVESDVNREIERLRPVFGNQFGVDQARALGVIDSVIQRLIDEKTLVLAARRLGVAISDDLVRAHVRNAPAFQGLGGFDRSRFVQVLRNNGVSEEGYLAMVREQMGREQLLDGFGDLGATPKVLVDAVYRYRQEKRIAETIHILDSVQQGIPDPDTATLDNFHRENAARFTAPEYRTLTVIRLEAAELADEVAITDAQIKEAYEAGEDEFTTPETRDVLQIVVTEQSEADRASQMLSDGRDFAAVAKEIAGMDAASIDLGKVTRDELTFPELAEAVFALGKDETSAPVKSPLGWHLLRVTGVGKGGTKSLEEVRESLRRSLSEEKAVDSLFELANRLEDSLGGGATMEEAATRLNLKTIKIAALDKKGLDRAGKRIEGLPGGDFLNTAFATEEGSDSLLIETGSDGYYILRMDGVTPPTLRPMESIKAEVAKAWKAEQRAANTKKSAETVVARVKSGAGLDVIAGEMGLTPTSTPPLTRRPGTDAGGLPLPLIAEIFAVKPGEAVMARSGQGYYVARLKKIIAANPAADRDGFETLSDRIGDALEGDIVAQFTGALRDRYGVSINRRAVDGLFTGISGRRPVRGR